MKKGQSGFHLLEIIIAVVVVGLIGFVAWMFIANQNNSTGTNNKQNESVQQKATTPAANTFVSWNFNGDTWQSAGEAPPCKDPYVIDAPMDMSKATSVLYPGQMRGGDFKPHGGLGAASNNVQVYAAVDAYLYRGARYIEQGNLQYMLDFVDSCGFMHRYDHLATLSDELMKYTDQLPAAKKDDSKTYNFNDSALIKRGSVIATQIGHLTIKNAAFDYGLYDLRSPNTASQTSLYKSDQQRINDKQQSFFAVCWFDYLGDSDEKIAKSLPARGDEGKTSDYCK